MTAIYSRLLNLIFKQPKSNTLIDLFEEQVISNPDQTALVYKDEKLSYKQLDEKANQLVHYLRQKGVKEETLVPIYTLRSIEMIVAILGILKAGGAFVPIDPNYPFERVKFILEDIRATLIVTSIECKPKLLSISKQLDLISVDGDQNFITQMPLKTPPSKIKPDQLAYIIYTSGSTGNPKGVMVEHKSIFNYLLNSREKFINAEGSNSGTFIHIPYTFDASLKSIFTPLVAGKLAVISSEPSPLVFDDTNFHKYAPYDFIQLTPSHLDFFYAEFKDKYNRPITKKISIGGEALYLSHFDYLTRNGDTLEVINEYGPTETTVACTGYYFHAGKENSVPQSIPIGKPIKNVQIHILNDDLKPVKPGEEGEICVAGAQVARGYLNHPELTKKKFIQNSFSKNGGARMYRTGDIGRWMPDGNIEYVGRIDHQVKIRGYRVELGEIESILLSSDSVKNAVVEALANKQGDKELVAYIVPLGTFDKHTILDYLKEKLPCHLIPEKLVELKHLPLTSNGKIDRKSLLDLK